MAQSGEDEVDYGAEQRRPEQHLAPLQDDPGWRQWLSDQEIGLAHFFTNVVPDMPEQPYSREGLEHAEVAALRIFPDAASANPDRTPENNVTIDPFQRFIGEVFLRCFEGRWIHADAVAGYGPEPSVELPFSDVPIVVRPLLISIAERRRGGELTWVFDRQLEIHQQWVGHDRPAFPVWARIEQRLIDDGVL